MYFRVNIRVHQGGNPRDVTFIMETDHETLDDVFDDLVRDGLVMGHRFEARRDPARQRTWRVIGGYDMALGKEALCSLQAMNEDLIDADGTVLFSVADDLPDAIRAVAPNV